MFFKNFLLFFVAVCHAERHFSPRTFISIMMSPQRSEDHVSQSVVTSYDILRQDWKSFKETYNKNYESDEEDLKRMDIFARNKLFIAQHNELYEKGVVTHSVEMNKFGDLTTEEFHRFYGLHKENMLNDEDESNKGTIYLPTGAAIPKNKDWRKKGAVTAVKNQGQCGSCWAFSAAGALESIYFLHSKHLVDISAQNFVDCSTTVGNFGCGGGWPSKAFTYTKINKGVDTDKSYPYKAKDGNCKYNSKYSVTSAKGFYEVPKQESALAELIASYGPVSVSIDSHGDAFRFYSKGVHFNSTCSSDVMDLNHAVLVVGYGVTNSGLEYWIVKNSWGANWGERGYVRMARNRNNNCGIVTNAVTPII